MHGPRYRFHHLDENPVLGCCHRTEEDFQPESLPVQQDASPEAELGPPMELSAPLLQPFGTHILTPCTAIVDILEQDCVSAMPHAVAALTCTASISDIARPAIPQNEALHPVQIPASAEASNNPGPYIGSYFPMTILILVISS